MNQRGMLSIAALTALALTLPISGHAQNAQQRPPAAEQKPAAPAAPPKPMKEAIIGSWSLLIDDAVNADGTHAPNFGPNPEGIAMFGPDGHFSVTIARAGRAKFAANSRAKGTADENKATVTGSNAFFGTYVLDEPSKMLTLRIEGSTYPNLEGTTQKRLVTSLTASDELTWTNPETHGEVAWKWLK